MKTIQSNQYTYIPLNDSPNNQIDKTWSRLFIHDNDDPTKTDFGQPKLSDCHQSDNQQFAENLKKFFHKLVQLTVYEKNRSFWSKAQLEPPRGQLLQ